MDNNTEIQNAEAQYPKNAEVKEKTKEVKKQKRKVTRRNIIILILIIIILLLLTFRSCSKEIDVFLKGLNGNPVEMDLNKESIEIPVITTFNVDGRKTDVTLSNPVENEGKFCLQYDLYITDNEKEKLVYSSDVLAPLEHETVVLKEKLKKGSYKGKLQVSSFVLNSDTECNGSEIEVNVYVK